MTITRDVVRLLGGILLSPWTYGVLLLVAAIIGGYFVWFIFQVADQGIFGTSDSIDSEALQGANPRFTPQWSPDGSQIVFAADLLTGDIYVAATDGSKVRRVSDSGETKFNYSPDISPDGSRIAYATTRHRTIGDDKRSNDFEIETSRLDGSDRRRLTENGRGLQDVSPVWSPDGSRIAFVRTKTGRLTNDTGIYTMAADGSGELQVVSFVPGQDRVTGERVPGEEVLTRHYPNFLSWSPDGKTLAFFIYDYLWEKASSGNHLSRYAVYTVASDGTGLTKLYTTPPLQGRYVKTSGLAWSPDGSNVAFSVYAFKEYGETLPWGPALYIINSDGSGLRRISEAGGWGGYDDSDLQWFPAALRMLLYQGYTAPRFKSDPYGYPPISVVDLDGSAPREISRGNYASWSPDGSRIAVVQMHYQEDNPAYVYTMQPDGSDVRLLAMLKRDGGWKAAK